MYYIIQRVRIDRNKARTTCETKAHDTVPLSISHVLFRTRQHGDATAGAMLGSFNLFRFCLLDHAISLGRILGALC